MGYSDEVSRWFLVVSHEMMGPRAGLTGTLGNLARPVARFEPLTPHCRL